MDVALANDTTRLHAYTQVHTTDRTENYQHPEELSEARTTRIYEGRVTTDCLFMTCACLLCQALRGVVGGGNGGHVLEWSADFSTLPHAAQRYTPTHTPHGSLTVITS